MKKTLFIIGLCIIILSMPTFLAFPTKNKSSDIFSPLIMSDGTFVGGFGRGHWGNGFHIDTVHAYINGVYTSSFYTKLTGEITDQYNKKIGEISAYIISSIIIGRTKNLEGQTSLIVVILNENQNNQFVGRILLSNYKSSSHIWGYMIPNK